MPVFCIQLIDRAQLTHMAKLAQRKMRINRRLYHSVKSVSTKATIILPTTLTNTIFVCVSTQKNGRQPILNGKHFLVFLHVDLAIKRVDAHNRSHTPAQKRGSEFSSEYKNNNNNNHKKLQRERGEIKKSVRYTSSILRVSLLRQNLSWRVIDIFCSVIVVVLFYCSASLQLIFCERCSRSEPVCVCSFSHVVYAKIVPYLYNCTTHIL